MANNMFLTSITLKKSDGQEISKVDSEFKGGGKAILSKFLLEKDERIVGFEI